MITRRARADAGQGKPRVARRGCAIVATAVITAWAGALFCQWLGNGRLRPSAEAREGDQAAKQPTCETSRNGGGERGILSGHLMIGAIDIEGEA